jgi:cell wall-associated NlpC family hydrolase
MRSIISITLAFLVIATLARGEQAPERPVDRGVVNGLAERVEPGLKGQADRLQQYVDFFRREAANDVRYFAFNVRAEAEGQGGVRLAGYVEFPETRAALVAFFEALGFTPVDNQIKTLPAEELGEQRYGFVKVAHSLSYAESAAENVDTDTLLGEPLLLLLEENGHYLAHAGDGYLGFIATTDVKRSDEKTFAEYLAGPRVFIRADTKTDDDFLLPAGARLKLVRQSGDTVLAETPTGMKISMTKDKCDVRDAPGETIDSICANAEQLLGTKYLWGGKTSQGVDCSGLVQQSFARAGVRVPRDSNQQVIVGSLSATRWNRGGLRRGDTLYFINPQGRVSHTGLYLGEDQFIHAVSPVVRINSFNPKDENYAAAQDASFAFARRLWE